MIRTLVVEDEPLLAEAHRAYLERVEGYSCAGVARDGASALRLLAERPLDLVLLDVGLPDMTGLEVLRTVRARALPVDVIVVSSARELDVVRSAVSAGAVQYLLKPFTFAGFRDKLERYADYRRALPAGPEAGRAGAGGGARGVDQRDIDRALSALRGSAGAGLPKGLSADTLDLVVRALQDGATPLSASDVSAATGMSRVTARRYLEHLADSGRAERSARYGGGRPEHAYRAV